MRILVTEAASPLAYHVTGQLASQDLLTGQPVELVLCDRRECCDASLGLMYELQDCVHPNLKDVSVTSDLLESFKSVDVALILPKQNDEICTDLQIHINYALLSQVDFQGLDGVFHQRGLDMQEKMNVSASGPLSSAVKITSCLRNILQSAPVETSQPCLATTLAQHQEEAEFGIPPEMDGWSMASWSTGPALKYENKLMMIVVSITDSKQAKDTHSCNEDTMMSFISRL